MSRLIPLDRLKDPADPDPYANYRSGIKPEPPYDMLVVGRGVRHAFKGGVLVDERTGTPLDMSRQSTVATDLPSAPAPKRRGRPPTVR
jgi:hypothetical protein